jgi:hypothetical protein
MGTAGAGGTPSETRLTAGFAKVDDGIAGGERTPINFRKNPGARVFDSSPTRSGTTSRSPIFRVARYSMFVLKTRTSRMSDRVVVDTTVDLKASKIYELDYLVFAFFKKSLQLVPIFRANVV